MTAPTRGRDIARRVVVETNPYWPFSVINRLPYAVAIRAFVRRLRQVEAVKGVHLKNGLIRPDWIPGISDIDLTIVTDDPPDADRAYGVFRSIWAHYDAVKRIFPMLGDVEVMPARYLRPWSRFATFGHEARFWRPLHGDAVGELAYGLEPARLALDALNNATYYYLEYLLKRFFSRARFPALSLHEMHRIGSKVLRYAAASCGERCVAPGLGAAGSPSAPDLVAAVLRGLDESVRKTETKLSCVWAESPMDPPLTICGPERDLAVEAEPGRRLGLPDGCGVEAVVAAFHKTIVILRGDLSPAETVACIELLGRFFAPVTPPPLVVTPGLLRHVLHHHDPYLYTHLLGCGRVVYGPGVSLPPVPRPPSFAYQTLKQSQGVMLASMSRKLLPPADVPFLLGREFESIVTRALFVKMFVADGALAPAYGDLVTECRERFPEHCGRAAKIRAAAGKEEWCGRAAFEMLQELADDVARGIEETGLERRLFRYAGAAPGPGPGLV